MCFWVENERVLFVIAGPVPGVVPELLDSPEPLLVQVVVDDGVGSVRVVELVDAKKLRASRCRDMLERGEI